ncbi:bifunctional diaminohydroxyphosphoribosylaminopyrimidine deaminase/5-amino-6-(5-phosphoribosylamino)uracil reductase RibD [Gilvimarinus polysaccharolyticus]|uniref:bifunctional diaminohydroxyphosphoribosylaminopyrimidine deaminase/5-amino-6-(5-phosphoribosylamino)uracil reductase RibD n=1 Tax=Gilvimarinus polysaccharolyticus TaxID=863921 RepID=UPI00067340C1|nr:bifunctional diaminohydroxyphosphoribosylaminopyrimidine deaminase/5-amino-6-(5-phosphoribosylamino)uracil reductase RibD [Gilvimarinus polysaccharolyticus]
MNMTISDRAFMAEALGLARRGLTTTTPNPMVGCVLVRDGNVIGRGWHQRAGGPHAEICALRDAAERIGESADDTAAWRRAVTGATCYVTLEPCSHTGRTGPCAQALVEAGVARVVYAMEDPNPAVAGGGIMHLRDAGIEVSGPLLEEDALELNAGFIRRMTRGRPWVRCKLAMSLDGRTAMQSGESRWVTSRRAREDVQRLRAASCALITGVDTVLIDNATLTVRREDWPEAPVDGELRQPLRVILDSNQRLHPDCELVKSRSPILVVHIGGELQHNWPDHVEHLALPALKGRVRLEALLDELGRRGCNTVLVETGATLAGGFLRRALLDEIIIYMAPKLLGNNARGLFDLPVDKMSGQLPLHINDIRAVGHDWRITAVPDLDS